MARKVRTERLGTPVSMLTTKAEVDDRITGSSSGTDYYLTKPFDTREFLACINSLLRKHDAQVDEVTIGNTSLDFKKSVRKANSLVVEILRDLQGAEVIVS